MSSATGDLTRPPSPPKAPLRRGRARLTAIRDATVASLITTSAAAWLVAGLVTTAVWWLAGAGTYWPSWVWLGAGAPVATAALLRLTWRVPAGPARWATVHAVLAFVAAAFLAVVWLRTDQGDWLAWVLVGLGTAFSIHALLAFADRLPPRSHEEALSARVDELVRTRRGALDVEASELRRLERDLHDGAQARLVALTLQLGRAEQRLVGDPAARELIRAARAEASEAIAELRDLARGLAPPLLVDRGLATAVEALGTRSAVEVSVHADVPERLPMLLERAAYFVVAEALTNVAKHAPRAHASVTLAAADGTLVLEVADDGPGGADPTGPGLLGLRSRVEAIDGTLSVDTSETGTTIRAELPCGS